MSTASNRRRFLGAATTLGATTALGELGFLQALQPVSAQEARVGPDHVRLRPEIEPLVRLLEETAREQLLERVADRIRGGVSYQELLTALMLAGVRNIQPRPVGFKFHAVLVVHSAHQAALASPDSDRWLPLFWALDQFKASHAQNAKEGNWSMPALSDSALPSGTLARERFVTAMDRWDEVGADTAVARLARVAGADEVWELFRRYGARDFRDIGHKAIYVANASRTLQVIGWQHAEPVLRSLAYALLEHDRGNPADADEPADRPWRQNQPRVKQVRADWRAGRPDSDATRELLAALRTGNFAEADEQVIALLNRGVAAASLWDAVMAGAGELLMRQPGIVGIHCVTSANALHHAFQSSGSDETRLLMLLQAAAFMTMFRDAMNRDGKLPQKPVDALQPAALAATGPEALNEILATIHRDRTQAAQKTLAYLQGGGSAEALMAGARRLIFLKGTNSHDYKFSSAALEDFHHVGPDFRNAYLATAMFNLRGSGEKDNPLTARTRAALG